MELLQLKYFCDAAQTENFSKTAQAFRVPPSDISQTVKRLEAELGVALFDRRANRILLNATGRQFYEEVMPALGELEAARRRLLESREEAAGEIRLLVETNRRCVTEAIRRCREAHPQIRFLLNHRRGETGADYDLVIGEEAPSDRYSCRQLLITEEIAVALNRHHPLAEKEVLWLSDLRDERFISMHESSSLFRLSEKLCAREGFSPNVTIRTDDPFYVRKYVELDLGIAFVPCLSWKGLFSDEVVIRRLGSPVLRNTYVYHLGESRLTPAMRLFLHILRDTAGLPQNDLSEQ